MPNKSVLGKKFWSPNRDKYVEFTLGEFRRGAYRIHLVDVSRNHILLNFHWSEENILEDSESFSVFWTDDGQKVTIVEIISFESESENFRPCYGENAIITVIGVPEARELFKYYELRDEYSASIAWSSGNRFLAAKGYSEIHILDGTTGKQLVVIPASGELYAWSEDNNYILTKKEGKLQVYPIPWMKNSASSSDQSYIKQEPEADVRYYDASRRSTPPPIAQPFTPPYDPHRSDAPSIAQEWIPDDRGRW